MASLAQSTCRCSGLRTAAPRRAQLAVSAKAAGGFGANSGKAKKASVVETSSGSYTLPKKSKKVDIRRELAEGPVVKAEAQAAVADDPNANWLQMATVSGFPEGKDRQIVELAGKRTIIVFRYKGRFYCTDCNSTAYKFPLVDAPITDGPSGPQIEVPLDGTIYDLATGKVLKWCPSENAGLVRGLFSTLMAKGNPIDLPVFATRVTGDAIMVNYKPVA